MFKLKNVVVASAFVALATVVVWQELRARRFMAESASLRNQLEPATAAREESERLAAQLQSASERARADAAELARLRGQSARLRQVEQENAQLKSDRVRLARPAPSTAASEEERPAEPPTEAEIQAAKGFFGRDIGMALIMAARDNNDIVPGELRGPAIDMVELLAGRGHDFKVRQFELVFAGSLGDVPKGESRVLVREKEPVLRADGQWERVYVMTDGSSQRISAATREGFAAREKEFWPGQFGR